MPKSTNIGILTQLSLGCYRAVIMHIAETDGHGEDQFLTRVEVATLARTTVERVRYWDHKGLLPRVRPSGTRQVLYPRTQILAWLRGDWPPRVVSGGRQ